MIGLRVCLSCRNLPHPACHGAGRALSRILVRRLRAVPSRGGFNGTENGGFFPTAAVPSGPTTTIFKKISVREQEGGADHRSRLCLGDFFPNNPAGEGQTPFFC